MDGRSEGELRRLMNPRENCHERQSNGPVQVDFPPTFSAGPPWLLLAVFGPLPRGPRRCACGGRVRCAGLSGAVTGLRGWGFPDCFALRPETPTRSGPSPPVGGWEKR
ncbi:hypothetical protein Srufu_060270 [Streptomyces libani subsp. rufus]|nr:hypothetical protein Srufu_060270 [Streptomyces libani subsp. rufus]